MRISKHLSGSFSIHSVMKPGDALLPLLFNFTSKYTIRSEKIRKDWNWVVHICCWNVLTMFIYWVILY